MDDERLLARAIAAYYRVGVRDGGTLMAPNQRQSGFVRHKSLPYVVLRSGDRMLAVYRVKADGALRRLRRWPASLEER